MSPEQRYHQAQLRLRAIAARRETQAAERDRKREILQRYYDLLYVEQAKFIDPALEREAKEIERECAAEHDSIAQIRGEAFEALKAALREIGRTFGVRAKLDHEADERQRFRKWWRAANEYRAGHLDGIATKESFDTDGPMFKAFLTYGGFHKELVRKYPSSLLLR